MINRVLDLQNITVRQITIPLDQTFTVTSQTPMCEVLKLGQEKKFTRMPVCEAEGRAAHYRHTQSADGLVSGRTWTRRKQPGDYLKPALYMEENMRLEEALKRMQRSGQRLAIVLGRDQREIGVVSLEDILRVIFGEVSL